MKIKYYINLVVIV